MRVTSLLFFIIGIMVSLISAAKLPISDANWPDTLPLYTGAVILALGGLLLWHWSKIPQTDNQAALSTLQARSNVMECLPKLLAKMQELQPQLDHLEGKQIAIQVEILLNTYVLPLVVERKEIIRQFGPYQGVEILVAAAQGERLLNRIWSAASEGYLSEAIDNYPKAFAAFQKAYNQFAKVKL